MEGEEAPELTAAWKSETRWFQWTTRFTAGLLAGVLTSFGGEYWATVRLKEAFPAFAASGSMTLSDPAEIERSLAVTHSGDLVGFIGLVIILICGIGFLISLVKWLLAIRNRRALHAAGFASPTEARDSELEGVGKGE